MTFHLRSEPYAFTVLKRLRNQWRQEDFHVEIAIGMCCLLSTCLCWDPRRYPWSAYTVCALTKRSRHKQRRQQHGNSWWIILRDVLGAVLSTTTPMVIISCMVGRTHMPYTLWPQENIPLTLQEHGVYTHQRLPFTGSISKIGRKTRLHLHSVRCVSLSSVQCRKTFVWIQPPVM